MLSTNCIASYKKIIRRDKLSKLCTEIINFMSSMEKSTNRVTKFLVRKFKDSVKYFRTLTDIYYLPLPEILALCYMNIPIECYGIVSKFYPSYMNKIRSISSERVYNLITIHCKMLLNLKQLDTYFIDIFTPEQYFNMTSEHVFDLVIKRGYEVLTVKFDPVILNQIANKFTFDDILNDPPYFKNANHKYFIRYFSSEKYTTMNSEQRAKCQELLVEANEDIESCLKEWITLTT
jgi:hypothetical protein